MSRRGTRTACERKVIQAAIQRGWCRQDRNGTNHTVLVWPATGRRTQIPSNMDDGFARAITRRLIRIERGEA